MKKSRPVHFARRIDGSNYYTLVCTKKMTLARAPHLYYIFALDNVTCKNCKKSKEYILFQLANSL